MITQADIEYMRQTRAELVAGRQSDITLIYTDGGDKDPITGEPIGGDSGTKPAVGVVTEISSVVKFDRFLENGIEVEKGDIWLSVPIGYLADIYEKLTQVKYDGKTYEVLSKDKKGIGERNRAEFVGRLVS
ncbi:hypothetical protein [Heyndrickxia sporothermodurans]|uniref:hypothetical protein n=1 Tax=Heyndrickxia sporothermodurans TaxID=46224 RepID=UPI002E24C138|nr:hypothetical protein [Heyndrickxia sporothermodurans]MED3697940.1 hypothetical protein [Heyndrickxia sporothermodurans]